MLPDAPPPHVPGDEGNVVDPGVFEQRRIGHEGPDGLLARASAAERAVVSLESRLQEIERELGATALQRDELAGQLRERETDLRSSAQARRDAEEQETSLHRGVVQAEIKLLSERLAGADGRVADLQTALSHARRDIVDAEKELAVERARVEMARRDDADREARIRRAEAELEGRVAGVRAAEQEALGIRDSLETQRTGLEDRLREVDAALVELGDRLAAEHRAREAAESALVTERAAHAAQVGVLREELDRRNERFEDVQTQIIVLREEFVRAIDSGLERPGDDKARVRLKEIESDLKVLGKQALGLERERNEARDEAVAAAELLSVRDAELARLRGEGGAATGQIEVLRSDMIEMRSALETAREAQATAESKVTQERLARERLEAELQQERTTFAQQLEIADGQLRAEIEIQRRAFDDHAAAVERSIRALHEQLADARATMDQQVAAEVSRRQAAEKQSSAAHAALAEESPGPTPPVGELQVDLEEAAARLRELAAAEGAVAEPVEDLAGDAELREQVPLTEKADDLAQVIKEAQAEGEPLPRRELPAEPIMGWMAPGLALLNRADPETAARVVVDLLPALANDLGRDALLDFAIDELGAYRLTVHLGSGSITPWRAGASRQADLALAGSALALAPFAVGGAPRRKVPGVDHTGKRRMLRSVLKVRRAPLSLADIQGARVVPDLGNLLSLLSASVETEWLGGKQLVIGFEATGSGAGSWIARSTEKGEISVKPGRGDADAVITVPSQGIVPLFIGGETPVAGQATYVGDAEKALTMLGWFDQAQRSLPQVSDD
jgi:hypothetical protein